MSTTYTGVPANAADALLAITVPADGDPRNASSVNTPLEQLADFASKMWNDWQPNVGASARVLVRTISNNKTGRKTRLYVTAAGTLEITFNCSWSQGGTRWEADTGTLVANRVVNACRFRIDLDGLGLAGVFVDRPYSASAVHWTDSSASWETHVLSGAGLSFLTTKTDAFGTNPPASSGILNTLCAKSIPKAWGAVDVASGAASLVSAAAGLNVSAVARVSATAISLTFAEPLVGDYEVQVTMAGNGSSAPPQVVPHATRSGRLTTGFSVLFHNLASLGNWKDISSDSFGFDFSVHGTQTS